MLPLVSFYALLLLFSFGATASPQPASALDSPSTNLISLAGNQSATIPIINSSYGALNAADFTPTCFNNDRERAYQPVNLVMCTAIFPSFLLRPEVMQTKQWTPRSPLIMPWRFTVGDCSIRLSSKFANARDLFQEVEILQRAAMIMDRCLRGRPQGQRFGGTVSIGPRGAFQVDLADKISLGSSSDAF